MTVNIFADGFEGHVQRSLDRARRMSRGERLKPEKIVNFANALHLFECLSTERVRLLLTIRNKSLSISALAIELGRNRGSVTRDVNKLREFGLVEQKRGGWAVTDAGRWLLLQTPKR